MAFAGVKASAGFEQAPPGNYPGWLCEAIDLGTQQGSLYGAERKCLMGFELGATGENGEPLTIGRWVTIKLTKGSKMRELVEGMLGRTITPDEIATFDWSVVLDLPCMVNVTTVEKEGGSKSVVQNVTAFPSGMTPPERTKKPLILDLDDPSQEVFDQLSEGLQKIVAKSPEFARSGLTLGGSAAGDAGDLV